MCTDPVSVDVTLQSDLSEARLLQDRIEAEPYRAAAWALGIGFVAGVLITALARRR